MNTTLGMPQSTGMLLTNMNSNSNLNINSLKMIDKMKIHYLIYYSGYVPEHGKAIVDHGVGYAVGHDAIGHFDHHTGPFGPFGFYANYYHD